MKICDALTLALKKCGTDRVFGVSGANIEHFHDAIHRLGGQELSSVMAKSENGAAFMADAYTRVNKKMGVCCATSGAGMTNLISGIAESYQEGIGTLAIIGQPPLAGQGKGAFQDASGIGNTVNAKMLCQSVAKYVGVINEAKDFWPVLINAIKSCHEKRRGPSILLIPRNIFEFEVEPSPFDFSKLIKESSDFGIVSKNQLDQVWHELSMAKNPALIFGLGIKLSPYQNEAIDFAKRLGAPVFTTLSSKCAFPNEHPLYFGTLGVAGHPSAHDFINKQADLVLSLGTVQPLMMRGPISEGLERNTIAIDVDIEAVERAIPLKLGFNHEPGWFCHQLNQKMLRAEYNKPKFLKPQYQRNIVRPQIVSVNDNEATNKVLGHERLRQSEAIAIISDYLPEDCHLIFDAGNCAAAALHYLDIPKKSTATIALGMGGMGYSVGGAVGAQISAPKNKKTVAFLGDGAFLMSGFEVHTAFMYQLPILFVVFNNNRHGMCVTRQELFFAGRKENTIYQDVNISAISSGLSKSDQVKIFQVRTVSELHQALSAYQQASHLPAVLELIMNVEEMPPFTPFSLEAMPVIELKGSIKESILEVVEKDRAKEPK